MPSLALALLQKILTAAKSRFIRYYETVYESIMRQCMKGQGKYVLGYKNSGEVISKLESRGFRSTSLSTYDFSTQYTT